MFSELIAQLRSLEDFYKIAHWQCKNTVFYSDHLLLDRLSSEAGSRIDQVAEKAIGTSGNASIVNLKDILKKEFVIIKNLSDSPSENSRFFEDALRLEEQLKVFVTTQEPIQSLGVKNMLGDIADECEGRIYLLKQRLAKGQAPIMPMPIKPE